MQTAFSTARVASALPPQPAREGAVPGRLQTDFPDVFAQIPDAVEMIAFRNIIAHGYDLIDDELVWSSITSEVPPLTHLCEQLLYDRQHP